MSKSNGEWTGNREPTKRIYSPPVVVLFAIVACLVVAAAGWIVLIQPSIR